MPVVRCPNSACGVHCSVAEADAGRPVKCAKCGKAFSMRPTRDGQKNETKKGPPSAKADLFPTLPAEFGRYRVLRLLGKGGMGAVYLAEDSQLGRQVAVKLPSFDAGESQRVERFVREARSAASLQHPNICTVFDAGQIDGRPFITMAYVEGKTLADEIEPDAPMPQRRAAEVARKIARALEHAHQKGTVHRDLKPANVMLAADGEPVVMDFGLAKRVAEADPSEAKLTRLGGVLGTPSYMSPEQVRADGVIGPATDIYSLGVMLFEMLAGRTPYAGSQGVVMGQILHAPVPPVREFRPAVDARLDAICQKAMAKEPQDRYASMAEFAEALGGYLKAPTAVPPPLPVAPVAAARPSEATAAFGHSPFDDLEAEAAPSPSAKKRKKGKGLVVLALAVLLPLGGWLGTVALRVEKPNLPRTAAKDGQDKARLPPVSKGEAVAPTKGDRVTNSIGMRLVRIPAGKFRMGSPDGEGSDDERPEREVEITRAFHMGVHEVTQKQFEAVMGYNPSHFVRGEEGKGRLAATDDPAVFPVENVSWEEAKRFCDALSALPEEKQKRRSYRLPTEAEWEYACRGGPGPKTPYHFGITLSSNQANFDHDLGRPRAVGSYAPNGFGLYDMHGNVCEWCADWFGNTYYQVADNKKDPQGPETGFLRVLRGGSWSDAPVGCRAAYRTCFDPAARLDSFGFRVCFAGAD